MENNLVRGMKHIQAQIFRNNNRENNGSIV